MNQNDMTPLLLLLGLGVIVFLVVSSNSKTPPVQGQIIQGPTELYENDETYVMNRDMSGRLQSVTIKRSVKTPHVNDGGIGV